MRHLTSFLTVLLLMILGACTFEQKVIKDDNFAGAQPLSVQQKNAMLSACCTELTNLNAQLGNPFEISAAGCYDTLSVPRCFVFESDNPAALETAEGKYTDVPGYKMYAHYFSNALLFVSQFGEKDLSLNFTDLRFREAKVNPSAGKTEKEKEAIGCAADIAGYVDNYLDEGPGALRFFQPRVQKLVESSYAPLRELNKQDGFEDSAAYEKMLDDSFAPIAKFCRDGAPGGIFDPTKADK